MPAHPRRELAHAPLGELQRRSGQVQHLDVAVTRRQQVIHESGLAAAHIDDPAGAIRLTLLDEPERGLQMRAIPAELVRGPGAIDVFPVGNAAHDVTSGPPNQMTRKVATINASADVRSSAARGEHVQRTAGYPSGRDTARPRYPRRGARHGLRVV